MEAFAQSGARAVEEVLSPWLEGERQLDYEFLVGALHWIMADTELWLSQSDPL